MRASAICAHISLCSWFIRNSGESGNFARFVLICLMSLEIFARMSAYTSIIRLVASLGQCTSPVAVPLASTYIISTLSLYVRENLIPSYKTVTRSAELYRSAGRRSKKLEVGISHSGRLCSSGRYMLPPAFRVLPSSVFKESE